MDHKFANVMIVDDDPVIHHGIARIARYRPCMLFPAYGGYRTFQIVQSISTEQMLLDPSMPPIYGLKSEYQPDARLSIVS
jgi:YesN/AraC family two-component response regulator